MATATRLEDYEEGQLAEDVNNEEQRSRQIDSEEDFEEDRIHLKRPRSYDDDGPGPTRRKLTADSNTVIIRPKQQQLGRSDSYADIKERLREMMVAIKAQPERSWKSVCREAIKSAYIQGHQILDCAEDFAQFKELLLQIADPNSAGKSSHLRTMVMGLVKGDNVWSQFTRIKKYCDAILAQNQTAIDNATDSPKISSLRNQADLDDAICDAATDAVETLLRGIAKDGLLSLIGDSISEYHGQEPPLRTPTQTLLSWTHAKCEERDMMIRLSTKAEIASIFKVVPVGERRPKEDYSKPLTAGPKKYAFSEKPRPKDVRDANGQQLCRECKEPGHKAYECPRRKLATPSKEKKPAKP